MAGARPQADGPKAKRRKVRKGTQSCWECRQRKVRCIFTADTDAICETCERRGTACTSQEYADGPVLAVGSSQMEARLERVEHLIEHLVDSPAKVTIDHPSAIPTPAATATAIAPVQDKYEEISRSLTAAWPSQRDIDLICTLPVGISAHFHSKVSTPYSSAVATDPPSPREMLQLPPLGSHPVLIARKLLLLGTFLQGVVPSAFQDLADLGPAYRHIMSTVVDTAVRLVTTNEDLIRCVEGIECIMLEAMYHNYGGNLHRAWMAVRRGITVAEMMALPRGLNSPSLKILEPETRAAFNADQVCFRLVEMDCYLSLMLGMPRTSLEANFATPKALEGCEPIDRVHRWHCVIAERILLRNERNVSETCDIDVLLQKVAAEMPPRWWLMPNFSASNSGGTEVFLETLRFMDQCVHYHLLLRLHLPYMLHSSPDRRSEHSKITAVSASRETLARFVAFRSSNPAHFYCRSADFVAFIAATVLCLAHIDSYGRCERPAQTTNPGITFNFLAHSRPSDRGMMERTLEIIESMARTDTDPIASKIGRILRPLLVIEADAANGTSYSTNSSNGDEGALECHGQLTDGGKGLHVHIPHFGTIKFERGAISKYASTAPEQSLSTTLAADMLLPSDSVGHNPVNPVLPSSPDRPPADQTGSQLDSQQAQTVQLQISQLSSPQQPLPHGNSISSFNSDSIQEGQLPVPVGFAYDDDDWGLQGVDVALFDSLFRGTTTTDTIDDETWAQWGSNG